MWGMSVMEKIQTKSEHFARACLLAKKTKRKTCKKPVS